MLELVMEFVQNGTVPATGTIVDLLIAGAVASIALAYVTWRFPSPKSPSFLRRL